MKKGQKVLCNQLSVNDLFYMEYGFSAVRFRVRVSAEGVVFAHALNWMKSDCILINDEMGDKFYVGKISKLRAFFLM